MKHSSRHTPTLAASLVRGMIVFVFCWFIVAVILNVLIPTDATGDPADDATNRSNGQLIGIAAFVAAIGLAALNMLHWRRKHNSTADNNGLNRSDR